MLTAIARAMTIVLWAALMLNVTALPAKDSGCVAECAGSAPSSLCCG